MSLYTRNNYVKQVHLRSGMAIRAVLAVVSVMILFALATPASAKIDAEITGVDIPDTDQIQVNTTESVNVVTYTLVNPARVIVDFPGTALVGVPRQRMVNESAIIGVSIVHYKDADTEFERLTVLTPEGTGYAEIIIGNKLILNLYAPEPEEDLDPGPQEAAPVASGTEAAAPLEAGLIGNLVPLAGGRTLTWATLIPGAVDGSRKADKTYDITITEYQGATEVLVTTNGDISDFEDFNLPMVKNRVVLDMWGMKGRYKGGSSFGVDSAEIKRLRVGQHPDKFRIVADLNPEDGAVRNYAIEKESTAIKLYIFAEDFNPGADGTDFNIHTVQAGESLASIAQQYYGSSRDWRRILTVNRDRLSNPQAHVDSDGSLRLATGDMLRIPVRP